MKKILVPIDLSPSSKKLCSAARAFADETRGQLVLLHVMQPPPVTMNEFSAIDAAQLSVALAAGEKTGSRRLAQFAARISPRTRAAKTLHRIGSPVIVILEEAKKLKADYIVIGSHGHSALHDLVLGSTTHGVLKDARCPVLVIPTAPTQRGRK